MDIIPPQENIIYEDHDTMVILSIDPISAGHVVIKPVEPYKDIDELPLSLLNKIFWLAQRYVSLIKRHYHPAGYSIMQNGGIFNDTGQFHLHVFPRNNIEEFSWTYIDEVDPKAFDFKAIRDELHDDFYQSVTSS